MTQWGLLNNLPDQKVRSVVTDRILQMDKNSCQAILERILAEKKFQDNKIRIQKSERRELLTRLREKHNNTIKMES